MFSFSVCQAYANARKRQSFIVYVVVDNTLFDILDSGVLSRNIYDTAAKYSAAQNASLQSLSYFVPSVKSQQYFISVDFVNLSCLMERNCSWVAVKANNIWSVLSL